MTQAEKLLYTARTRTSGGRQDAYRVIPTAAWMSSCRRGAAPAFTVALI